MVGGVSGFGDSFIGGICFGFKFEFLIAGVWVGVGVAACVRGDFVGGFGGVGIGAGVDSVIGLIFRGGVRVTLGAGTSN